MEAMTEGIIIAVKTLYGNGETNVDCVKNFLADYCEAKITDYTNPLLYRILKEAFCDYVQTADHRYNFLCDYFIYKDVDPLFFKDVYVMDTLDKEIRAILLAFQNVQVREKDDNDKLIYVNGFKDFNFNTISLSCEKI